MAPWKQAAERKLQRSSATDWGAEHNQRHPLWTLCHVVGWLTACNMSVCVGGACCGACLYLLEADPMPHIAASRISFTSRILEIATARQIALHA